MNLRLISRVLPVVAMLASGVLPAQELHLKSRVARGAARPADPSGHRIIEFDHAPGVEDLARVVAAGGEITGALPDNAVVVSGLGTDISGVRWSGRFEAEDKLSPELDASAAGLNVLVEFHPDVTVAVQEQVAAGEGLLLLRPAVLLRTHALVFATGEQLLRLGAHDEVAYIFPAETALGQVENTQGEEDQLHACAGMLTLTGRVGQYANLVHGWDPGPDKIAHLSYVFGTVTTRVPAALAQAEVLRALNEWAKNANIIFQPGQSTSGEHTVYIRFASGAHGDSYPFDGPGGTLAHTFYPVPVNPESIAGDMHLDADENWHAGGDLDIYSVALHEAGHALGLGHSDKPGDVMYPYYRRNMALSANDIGALRTLYGAPTGSAPAGNAPAGNAPTGSVPTGGDPVSAPAPVPASSLSLTLDPVSSTTQAAQITLSGVAKGGTGTLNVQWQSDHGNSGRATVGNGAFLVSGIPVVNGSNAISFTAFDAAGHSASRTVVVTRSQPAGGAGAPVSIRISTPAGSVVSTAAATVSVTGTASGANGIGRVVWQTAAGKSGEASGTEQWLAQGIPLLEGTNTVMLRAWDKNGASAWAAMVVIRH